MIKHLALTNFRSYKDFGIDFTSPVVTIIGPNAVGKTNLLESIYVSATTKSFRAHDPELVNFEAEFYKVRCQHEDEMTEVRYVVTGDSHHKTALLGDVKKPLSYLVGRHPVVLFEPRDLSLLYDGPSQRRRYLDTILSQVDRAYMKQLSLYRRILKQRNSLLHQAKKYGRTDDMSLSDQLFVFDVQLAEPAQCLMAARADFLKTMADQLNGEYGRIAKLSHEFVLEYQPSVSTDNEYLSELRRAHVRDVAAGFSTLGPHRDDFSIVRDNRPVVEIVSRGEMRTLILAMKLSEIEYMQAKTLQRPTLLLDDVFSELDERRRQHLIAIVGQQQTFITATELDGMSDMDIQVIDLSGVGHG